MHSNNRNNTSAGLKDLKDLAKFKQQSALAQHPNAFDLDNDDPELDLETWKSVRPLAGRPGYQKLQPGEMSVRFQVPGHVRRKRNLASGVPTEATELYLRFGTKLIKNLGWREGEHLAIFQHPQDKTVYGLMPKPHGSRLRQEGTAGGMFYMQFSWANDLGYLTQKAKVADHHIHENGYLLFRLPAKESD